MQVDMQISNLGLVEIATYEGICLRPYYDSVGVITIGIGSTISDIPDLKSWPLSKIITVQEAFSYFTTSLQVYVNAVNKTLVNPVYQYQFDALVSICYNIGCEGLQKSTFMKKINANALPDDIKSAIMAWNKPPEIIGRRTKEASLYCTGIYSSNGFIEMMDTDRRGHQLQRTAKEINVWSYITKE